MSDLSALNHTHFEACLQQRFQVELAGGSPLEVELVEVLKRGAFDPEIAKRQAFSLVFRGPREPVLPQRIYAMRHPTLGRLEIFLVPIGPERTGMRYEAVFT